MGLGTTFMQVAFLSIVAQFYGDRRGWLIGILEACAGMGMMAGPLIGTCLYALGGYLFLLLVCGTVFGLCACAVPLVFPKYLDLKTKSGEE